MDPIRTATTMVAYRFKPSYGQPLREEIPVPTISEDEVLLQILAAGVCHTDVNTMDVTNAMHKAYTTSFTLGHEAAGIIVAVGASVESEFPALKEGTYVATYAALSCFKPTCIPCSSGYTNLCRENRLLGLGSDGSWTSFLAIRASCVVPVPGTPKTIAPALVAVATDAVITPYHALKACCNVQPGETVLCIGIGGLGVHAVSIAKYCLDAGCVIACDKRPSVFPYALEMGADYTVVPDDLPALLAEKKLTVDVVVDFVGVQSTFDFAYSAVKHGGTIHIVGLSGVPLQIHPLVAMWKDVSVKFSFYGTKEELGEVLQAIADGKIKPKVESRPMDSCAEVLKEMHDGTIHNRIALIPQGV